MNGDLINGIDVSEHLGLIGMAVRNSRWAIGTTLEWKDLFQAGYFGLRRAAEKFDASRGHKFSTYALPWVRHHVRRAAMNDCRTVRVPVWIQERRGRSMPAYPLDAVSLDGPAHTDERAVRARIDSIAADVDPSADLDVTQRRKVIEASLAKLPQRLREVLVARFWGEESLAEIGRRLDLSRERIRQLEAEALHLLRAILEEEP